MSKNREEKHAKHLAEQKAHEQHRHEEEVAPHEEHFVEAPKGTSRARFLFNFLLVVFLLLIFSITGPLMDALTPGGNRGDEVHLSWTLPDGESKNLSTMEFYQEKRNLASIQDMFGMLGMQGLDVGDDKSTARFLITEDLARWSGVSASSSDVAEMILTRFGDQETYKRYIAARRGTTHATFEKMLMRARTVQRYMQLLLSGADVVSPLDIADAWKTSNQEYDFQYVQLTNEDFDEAARAELPGAEELQDWFDALPPFQKARFNSEPSWSADLAWYDSNSDAAMEALFEAYPRPEDEDADEMAQNYYNSFNYVRFKRPEPEDGSEVDPQDRFLSFEEVAEIAKREAPIYYSLTDFLSHMQLRIDAGEAVDFEAEATALGLQYVAVNPRTRNAWAEGEEVWSGSFLAQSTASLPEGRLATRVTVEEQALVIPRVVEKFAPSLPPFEEIRDKVADQWVEERRAEIAVERLAAVRATFQSASTEGDDGPQPLSGEASADLEAFKAAVQAAGFELVERGYRSRYPRPGDDPEDSNEADNYLQGSSLFYSLEPGVIAEPESSRDGKFSYLVRFGDKRDADLSKMDPSELEMMTMQKSRDAELAFLKASFDDFEWLRREFNLRLKSDDSESEPPTN